MLNVEVKAKVKVEAKDRLSHNKTKGVESEPLKVFLFKKLYYGYNNLVFI
ncbi:hypothetical protein HanHA300_Chr06g0197381 [Helianthus annuus]|nr:hypothetical protein HanHA300_Chr06g0197381 [Helianthus annuus]KAJ0736578.1 hypothetical protein HanLR1_Chr06g0197461 [Helianthus annuus]KAJ0739522.1 hypothetical protein HanOQP8_Chr06g0206681 [Helianthus annuus]